jgi:hypothetical protein
MPFCIVECWPFDAPSSESDVIRLLESGKNVISAVAFNEVFERMAMHLSFPGAQA